MLPKIIKVRSWGLKCIVNMCRLNKKLTSDVAVNVTKTLDFALISPFSGATSNGSTMSHSKIVSRSLKNKVCYKGCYLVQTTRDTNVVLSICICFETLSNALHEPKSNFGCISRLYCGNKPFIGTSNVYSVSNTRNFIESLYWTLSSGLNVTGKVNDVPGLSVKTFG